MPKAPKLKFRSCSVCEAIDNIAEQMHFNDNTLRHVITTLGGVLGRP